MDFSNLLEISVWKLFTACLMVTLGLVIPITRFALQQNVNDRSNDGVMAGISGFSSTAFLLVSIFISAQTLQQQLQNDSLVTLEMSQAVSLMERAAFLPEPKRLALNKAIKDYAQACIDKELNHLTGLPHLKGTSGDPTAQASLQTISTLIQQVSLAPDISTANFAALSQAHENFRNARKNRVSARELLPDPVFGLMLVLGFIALISNALYPRGQSERLKWYHSITFSVVINMVLLLQVVLLSPQTFGERRQSIAQDLIVEVNAHTP